MSSFRIPSIIADYMHVLGIPGLTHDGHRVLLYPALIDCLQTFDYFKRVQHTLQNLRDPKRGAEYR